MRSKALFLVVIAGLIFTAASCSRGGHNATEIRGGETRQTLSPDNFVGPTAEAYRIAREIPEILDSLYCYCDCEKHFGHKSLLTCYVDEHAVHCDVCQDEAFMAYDLHKQGLDAQAIRKAVDKKFSSMRH